MKFLVYFIFIFFSFFSSGFFLDWSLDYFWISGAFLLVPCRDISDDPMTPFSILGFFPFLLLAHTIAHPHLKNPIKCKARAILNSNFFSFFSLGPAGIYSFWCTFVSVTHPPFSFDHLNVKANYKNTYCTGSKSDRDGRKYLSLEDPDQYSDDFTFVNGV